MRSVSLGPLALPLGPLLLILGVWLGAWVASWWARHRGQLTEGKRPGDELVHAAWWGLLCARLVHVGLHADLYLAQPLSILDVRDGGWHALSGWSGGLAWLLWRAWRQPAWRQALMLGTLAGGVLWAGATVALSPNQAERLLPNVLLRSVPEGTLQPLPSLAKGQLRVINLWASWCGPCRQEMPMLAALQRSETDVQFLFINQGETAAAMQTYLQQSKLSLQGVWMDADASLGPALGVSGLPATLFVDAQGNLVDLHFGVISEPALKARLRALREAK